MQRVCVQSIPVPQFFQWAFAATAATIPAGCVAERFNFNAYLAYTVLLSAWIYPVVAHWVWSREGWLTYFDVSGLPSPHKQPDEILFGSGMIDFAGSAVIHLVGGFTGMMGAWLVGPRIGRFDSLGKPVDMPGHSVVLTVLGTVLLWFGWYGFNPGSVLVISSALSGEIAGRAACCTTLSGAAAGLTCLVNAWRRGRYWDLGALCNGVLVGFVSITAGAHVVEPWAAIIAGFVGALVFDGMCWVFLKLRIDDPLCAAPMHGWVGMWAVLFVGLLAKQEYVIQSYGTGNGRGDRYGAFYPGGNGHLLASQLIGVLTISAWVCGQTGLLFFALKKAGLLRISLSEEMAGLDISRHGGAVYNMESSKDPLLHMLGSNSGHPINVLPSSTEKGTPEGESHLDEANVPSAPKINMQPYKAAKIAPEV
ncbi:ammonium transporter AmtB-like domain-containing protein [Dunaliella salina]|uniref:Ammonium transporter AmtB-like domain-containing protein n=1 Tax=Dunaliella salina TaxID=3046 RepID=A0ABQ7FWE2_DUNSA|nr:ammonium transporter AmtB-like domain-containing protein [Dunaliella salina]|eukprot:KAF5826679.1 ammonium transporter AmtB-like domain-containing protein [Dunaliella salina]